MKYKISLIIWLSIIIVFTITYLKGLSITDRIEYGALYIWPNRSGEWWRVITYGFLHNSLQHFLGNIAIGIPLTLYVENRTSSKFTLIVFVLGVVGGGVSYLLFNNSIRSITTGASAGVWALLAVATFELFSKELINMISLLVLLNLNIILFYDTYTSSNVNVWGHLGGYTIGFVIIMSYIVFKTLHIKIKKEVTV